MATTQKKTGGSRSASSAGGKRTTTASGSSRAKSGGKGKTAQPAPRPFRREVGAAICLLLAIFASFGYFTV